MKLSSIQVGIPFNAILVFFALYSSGCDGNLEVHNGRPSTDSADEVKAEAEAKAAAASLHRLNRLEYNNAVRDLLGTSLRPADRFPPDASVGGFDNVASVLNITPALMDRYVGAAASVVEDAFAARPVFSDRFEENDVRFTYSIDRDANSIGGIVRLRGGAALGEFEASASGSHTLVVRTQGLVNGTAAAPRMRVSVAGNDFDFDVPRDSAELTFALDLQAGRHPIGIAALNFEENAAENRGNDIMFDYLVIRSDEQVEGPARQLVMTCDPDVTGCANTVVHDFARRAWRRPLSNAEKSKLDEFLLLLQTSGESTEDSIKLGLRAILTSAKFLYRYRALDDSDAATLLDPYVLASRLSFFLWSTIPDDRLLTSAQNGTLSTPEGIRQTVEWMLADPRSSALADGFAEQWLDLRHLDVAAPSPDSFPEFNEAVRESMRLESKLFFLDFIENQAAVATMLEPDFAYRDATLAAHLGVSAPQTEGFERMAVGPGDRRGLLSLSAWLTSRSDSTHPSPIRRGSWLADNMLCTPVPPPPAGLEIGQLPEADTGLSLRARLEMHRDNPTCASCHTHLDVLGMGFETFDGVGRLVDEPSLDSMGELPGAGEFRGADEMAAKADRADFVMCVSRKLFTYALGRKASELDLKAFTDLADPVVLTLTLPDLVTAIVLSPAFSEPIELK